MLEDYLQGMHAIIQLKHMAQSLADSSAGDHCALHQMVCDVMQYWECYTQRPLAMQAYRRHSNRPKQTPGEPTCVGTVIASLSSSNRHAYSSCQPDNLPGDSSSPSC